MNQKPRQQREHFRINYPLTHQAKFLFAQTEFPIMDISQKGLKFSIEGLSLPEEWDVGMRIKGSVKFLFGESCPIEAKVLRADDSHIILFLEDPIPLKFMYDEHRYLIKHFDYDTQEPS